MGGLARDGTAELVSRDQIIRCERGCIPSSADHEEDCQPNPFDPYSVVVVVVFILKTVLTSIQYPSLFLTLQGKETNFRGHRLTQNKAQKNNGKIKKTQRKSSTCEKTMIQVPKNNRFRKTRSRLGYENPKKKVEPIAPNSEAESQTKYTIPV